MLTIKQGDTRTAIKATLIGPNNKPVDLTGATVRFLMADQAYTPFLSRPAIITCEAEGQVLVVFQPGDTDNVGLYKAEFKTIFSDGRIETYPNDKYVVIKIIPDLG